MHHITQVLNGHVHIQHSYLCDILQASLDTPSDVLTFINKDQIFQNFTSNNTVQQIVHNGENHTVDFQYNFLVFGNHCELWLAHKDKMDAPVKLSYYMEVNTVLIRRLPNQKLAILVALNDNYFLRMVFFDKCDHIVDLQLELDGTCKEMCKIHTEHSSINHISVSPDGNYVCGTTSNSCSILYKFDMQTGTFAVWKEMEQGGSYGSSINVDNTLLYAIDPYLGKTILYRISDMHVLWTQSIVPHFFTVGKFSPVHADLLAYCTKEHIVLHDVRLNTKWQVKRKLPEDECAMSFSANGSRLYVAYGTAIMVIAIDGAYCRNYNWFQVLLKNAKQCCYSDVQFVLNNM